MASFLEAWRERSAWKRTRVEGRHLVKEARRILKRRGRDLSEEVVTGIKSAIVDVEEALSGSDQEEARRAIAALDERMDQGLSGARKSTLREYSESIGVAIAIALVLRAFVVEAFQIPSGSMIPTLEVGDHIFVSKFAYGLGIPFTNIKILELNQPERGDVIVFKYPIDPSTDYIKRVVGLPGDVVEVRQHEVFINGHPMPRQRLPIPCPDSESRPGLGADERDCEEWEETLGSKRHATIQEPGRGHDFSRTVVPPGNVFVMGDNRDNSSDSRVWGTVQHDLIKGKALIIWWSRAPAEGWNLVTWFKSIRWGRFFQIVR
ncbi:MAG TPA: signal peptidase I [Polyangia bacterium]|jgi:signal peptidase I|nr:signal peptidase I [Polyangia bacterium]